MAFDRFPRQEPAAARRAALHPPPLSRDAAAALDQDPWYVREAADHPRTDALPRLHTRHARERAAVPARASRLRSARLTAADDVRRRYRTRAGGKDASWPNTRS